MLEKLNTRVILLVVLALNVIALGSAEVQRRALVQNFPDLQSQEQLKMNRMLEEQQTQLEQQRILLDQLKAVIDVTNKKITHEIEDTGARFIELSDRVEEIKQLLQQAKQSPQ